MFKLCKSEFIKYFYGKKILSLIACLIGLIVFFTIIILNFKKSHITVSSFMDSYFNGFLISPFLPIMLIILSAQTVALDYTLGCTKFFLISNLKKQDIIIGKIIFITLIILFSLVFSYLTSFAIGCILFKGIHGLNIILKNYIYSIPALYSLCVFTITIALVFDNFQNTLMISIGSYIFMLIVDSILPSANFFTLTAVLSNVGNITNNFTYMSSVIYSLVFTVASIIIMRKKDVLI
ncbi:hypothetical protein LZ906_016510 (plasmid) [Paraclostridium ghonii]|uniref:hypothetical protein n=1 Tax=Paraclostridium ghonii TaxID=29358 RepID=UPI00202CB7F8|nr:hypothetical protein [Paeniclostridium ghonii]MCM0166575.1 hypothetical protein [Paeniclostridium ghonii]